MTCKPPLLLLFALLLAACRGGDEPSASAGSALTADSAPAPAPAAASAPAVRPDGIGEVRVGMTVSQALGRDVAASTDPQACEYVWSSSVPRGVQLMSVGGRIARVDVTEGETATAEGARIGDAEERVRSLYPGIATQPHKYTDGRYLVVTPSGAGAAEFRIVFETDGSRVTRYRAGKLPEVEWVEGCS